MGDPFVRERPRYRAAGAPVPRGSIGAICVERGVKREGEQGEDKGERRESRGVEIKWSVENAESTGNIEEILGAGRTFGKRN